IGLPTANTPTFSPPSGSYVGALSVTLATSSPGATIYYTTDGSAPTRRSPQYSGPLPVSATMTITAMAEGSGYKPRPVAASSYVSQPGPAAAPTFSPTAGTYGTPQTVQLLTASAGAVIYYTTDGSVPTIHSAQYTGPIPVSTTTAIQAFAGGPGFAN